MCWHKNGSTVARSSNSSKEFSLLGDHTVSSVPLTANPLSHKNFITFIILSSRELPIFLVVLKLFHQGGIYFSSILSEIDQVQDPSFVHLAQLLSLNEQLCILPVIETFTNTYNLVFHVAVSLQVKQYRLHLANCRQ